MGRRAALLAAAAALSGQDAEAHAALAAFNRLRPGFTLKQYKTTFTVPGSNAAFDAGMERYYEGLRKAGMSEGEPALAN
jgi:hypothetical protein